MNYWIHFTKLAVSRLIMVRFEKFKIWRRQGFCPILMYMRMTSRTWRHAMKLHAREWCHAWRHQSNYLSPTIGCQAVAREGLSLKTLDRFSWFLAGKFLWWSRAYHRKFSTIRQIPELWENFAISMATDWNFKVSFLRALFRAPPRHLCKDWCP